MYDPQSHICLRWRKLIIPVYISFRPYRKFQYLSIAKILIHHRDRIDRKDPIDKKQSYLGKMTPLKKLLTGTLTKQKVGHTDFESSKKATIIVGKMCIG